jgi:hypothetical protein
MALDTVFPPLGSPQWFNGFCTIPRLDLGDTCFRNSGKRQDDGLSRIMPRDDFNVAFSSPFP